MKIKEAHIAIDLHSKNSVIGYMNQAGKYFGQQQVSTGSQQLIREVVRIPAESKRLVIEQTNMSQWAASELAPYVQRLVICDPRHNKLISRSSVKNDRLDTRRLCELLRMGARRLFYCQIKEYETITKNLTAAKRQLVARLRHWGYNGQLRKADYKNPEAILQQIPNEPLRRELASKWERIGFLADHKAPQMKRIIASGEAYPEIKEFQKMAGAGPVSAHTFSGYIQTPCRFSHQGQLIKFSRLAVRKHSSDSHRLRGERLSKQGHSSLKNASHTIWKSAMGSTNEVSNFYRASLKEVGDPDKARLNTQRKILITLWTVWKHHSTYDPNKFTYHPVKGEATH
jgi:transposase